MTEAVDETERQPAYVGIDRDGCACAVVVDTSDRRTAYAVAGFILDGLAVERTTVGAARENLFQPWPWPHHEGTKDTKETRP